MQGYCQALGPVTGIALNWPGFIWIHDDSIIGMAERRFGTGMAANLSPWRDVESPRSFMTCPEHAGLVADDAGALGRAMGAVPAISTEELTF